MFYVPVLGGNIGFGWVGRSGRSDDHLPHAVLGMAVCQESRPSLEDILSRYDLKKVNLEAECPREVRNDIAVRLDNWEIVGFYLDFSLEKIREIDRENRAQELCKLALLDAWGKKEGKRATYVKLARALHRSQRNDLVEFLCTKVKSTTMGVVAVSTSGEDTSGSDTLDSRQLQPYAGSTGTMILLFVCRHMGARVGSGRGGKTIV